MADISITAASVLVGNGTNIQRTKIASGVTVTQGQYVTRNSSNELILADSNGTTPANTIYGVTLSAGSGGQYVDVLVAADGDSNFNPGATLTSGGAVYLSDTPGAITQTYADIASGSVVIILGAGLANGNMNFRPIVGGPKP